MSIRPIFAWYDFWVGIYWDSASRRLYLLPIPCCGVVLDFGPVTTMQSQMKDVTVRAQAQEPTTDA